MKMMMMMVMVFQDFRLMPRSAALRKLNDLIKRARLARVVASIFDIVVVVVVVVGVFIVVVVVVVVVFIVVVVVIVVVFIVVVIVVVPPHLNHLCCCCPGARPDRGRTARGDAGRLWQGGEEEESSQTP